MKFFATQAERKAGSSPAYLKALASFSDFAEDGADAAEIFSETSLTDWWAHMYAAGFTPKTRLLYFNCLSALYTLAARAHLISPTEAFHNVKTLMPQAVDFTMERRGLDRALAMTRSASARSIAADIVRLSLMAGCMSLTEVARLKKTDAEGLNEECRAIALRHISPRRSYIFDLGQARLTPRHLGRKLDAMLRILIATENLPAGSNALEMPESWWAYAALRCGVRLSAVRALLGHVPEGIPVPSIGPIKELPPEERADIIARVGETFVSNPLKWYAMRLRPRVAYEELEARLGAADVSAPELFYPLDVIARRTGRKLVFERQPVIKNIVFFHCREAEVAPLFRHISDLAWCYTVTGKSGSAYAAIPERSFRKFQEAIGHYTAQYEAETAAVKPERGADIKVTSGLFRGLESSLDKIVTENGENIFRLLHTGTNGFSWNIGVSPRQAKVCTARGHSSNNIPEDR